MITSADLHWNEKRTKHMLPTGKTRADVLTVLATLTPEQEEAVRYYGCNRKEEGWDEGHDEGPEV